MMVCVAVCYCISRAHHFVDDDVAENEVQYDGVKHRKLRGRAVIDAISFAECHVGNAKRDGAKRPLLRTKRMPIAQRAMWRRSRW